MQQEVTDGILGWLIVNSLTRAEHPDVFAIRAVLECSIIARPGNVNRNLRYSLELALIFEVSGLELRYGTRAVELGWNIPHDSELVSVLPRLRFILSIAGASTRLYSVPRSCISLKSRDEQYRVAFLQNPNISQSSRYICPGCETFLSENPVVSSFCGSHDNRTLNQTREGMKRQACKLVCYGFDWSIVTSVNMVFIFYPCCNFAYAPKPSGPGQMFAEDLCIHISAILLTKTRASTTPNFFLNISTGYPGLLVAGELVLLALTTANIAILCH